MEVRKKGIDHETGYASVEGEIKIERKGVETGEVNIRDLVTKIMRTHPEPTPLAVFFAGVKKLDEGKLHSQEGERDSIVEVDSVIREISFIQRMEEWLKDKFPYGIEPYHSLRRDGEQAEKSLGEAVQKLKELIGYGGPAEDVRIIVSPRVGPLEIMGLLKARWMGDKKVLDSIEQEWLGGKDGLFYPYNVVGMALELLTLEKSHILEKIRLASQKGDKEKAKRWVWLKGLTFLAAVRIAYETVKWEKGVREFLGDPWGDIFFSRIIGYIPDIVILRGELGSKKTAEVTYEDRWKVIEDYLIRWERELDLVERELEWSRKESIEKRYEVAKAAVEILQAQSFWEGLQVVKGWLYPQLKERSRGVQSDVHELLESITQELPNEVITEEDKLRLVRDLVVLYGLLERGLYAPATRALLTILIARTFVEGGNFLRSESSVNNDRGGRSQERIRQVL